MFAAGNQARVNYFSLPLLTQILPTIKLTTPVMLTPVKYRHPVDEEVRD